MLAKRLQTRTGASSVSYCTDWRRGGGYGCQRMIPLLDFLAAYYPRYVCPPCLAELTGEEETAIRTSLAMTTTPGLQLEAAADCLDCGRKTEAVRYKGS